MSLVCQVLGLDDDCHIGDVILGFLLKVNSLSPESQSVPVLNLDEYLAEAIHLQLTEFPKVQFFRFQTHLLNMLLCSNVTELKFISTLSSSDLPKQINLIEFANSIMSEIYRMLFDQELPRVLDEMKCLMQSSPEGRVGDWFLYRDYTVLRVYGFTGQPYRLPSFLTPRIFALEFMRQRLLSEEEHFGAFRKSLNIKFPFKVGPFIFKGKGALACIERLMENMDFVKDVNMNYDPH